MRTWHIILKKVSARRFSLLLLGLLLTTSPGHAVTFQVDSTADADDASKGNGVCATAGAVCTLRAAISEANSYSGGPHQVSIPAGTYTLTGTAGEDENNNVTGDLDVSRAVTITGAGVDATIIDGNGVDRVLDAATGGVTISGLTVRNGAVNSTRIGGCIRFDSSGTLTISAIKISGCTGYDGGGLYCGSGDVIMTEATVTNCSAGRKGGGMYIGSGSITITKAVIYNNTAVTDGGGMHTQSGGNSRMTNVTYSGNSTQGLGGGHYNQSGPGPTMINVTVAYNSATTSGGGIYGSSGDVYLKNSIVANNTPGNCAGSGITSNGYNIDNGSSCPFTATGDHRNTDPTLGVLQNNGGSTLTHALIIGSPAIEAGTSVDAPATDQRGVSRPVGTYIDIGAYEGTFIPSYQPDAMVKGASEAIGSYLTDNVYEAAASAQAKNGGALTGATATYTLLFQNDGNVADTLKITGTGTGSGFTVQYLDETSTDRTAAVTGAGYTLAALSPGASKVWTLKVSPTSSPAPVLGGASLNVLVTATSTTDGAKKDQVSAVTTSTSAKVSLIKSADKATAKPGDDILYTTNATNVSPSNSAGNLVLRESIPANTGFKVVIGNPSFNVNNSTLNCTISYSNDSRTSWTYTPASGGCSAPASYDYCVTDVEWRANVTDTMPAGSSFSVGLVVGVR